MMEKEVRERDEERGRGSELMDEVREIMDEEVKE